jgi:hypothetical protein
VKQLASRHNNNLVVGDDAQSIYSFRAADIGNILNFPKLFPAAKIFKLKLIIVPRRDILAVANDIISNNLNQYTKVSTEHSGKFNQASIASLSFRQTGSGAGGGDYSRQTISRRVIEPNGSIISGDASFPVFRNGT